MYKIQIQSIGKQKQIQSSLKDDSSLKGSDNKIKTGVNWVNKLINRVIFNHDCADANEKTSREIINLRMEYPE